MSTPNLGLPTIANSLNAHISVNTGFARIDALLQGGAISRTTTAQPGSPAAGDVYILPASCTGAEWSGNDDTIAIYYGGWVFITPLEGWTLYVRDQDKAVYYDGSTWRTTLSNLLTQMGIASVAFASLPSGVTDKMVFVTDGRKSGEGSGAGTGVLCRYNGSAWKTVDAGTTVAN